MRTMLIPLILVCSLAQFAIAGNLIPSGDCGTTYTCYAPAKCNRVLQPQQNNDVEKVKNGMKIFDDCDAIFRFHEYGTHHVHIIMESHLPTVQTIEFHQTGASGVAKNKFTCKVENVNGVDFAVGMWQVGTSPQDEKMYAGKDPHGTNDKLKCEFEAKKSPGRATFFDKPKDTKDKIFFNIDGVSTTATVEDLDDPRCDPENLEYIYEFNEKKLYKPVENKLGKFFCDNEYPYKFEYRLEDKKNHAQCTFECKAGSDQFVVDGKDITDADTVIDVRCAVDTDYFCKYTPSQFETRTKVQGRHTTDSDSDKHKKSELSCPDDEPHLIIKSTTGGRDKLILNVKSTDFACVSPGSVPVWQAGGVVLKKDKTQAYCTAEVDCNLNRKIRDNAVKNGRLNNVGLPICHFAGTMYVNSEAPQNLVTNARCDRKTGKFMYTAGNADHEIKDDTKLVCFTPKKPPTEKNAANVQKIVSGVGGVIGGVAGLIGVIGVILLLHLRWKLAKEKQQRELRAMQEDRACIKFTLNSKEKAAYLEAHPSEKSNPEEHAGKLPDQIAEEKSAKDELGSWNVLQMSFEHNFRVVHMAERLITAAWGGECDFNVFKEGIKIEKKRHELVVCQRTADASQKSIFRKGQRKLVLKAEQKKRHMTFAAQIEERVEKMEKEEMNETKAKK